MDAFQVPKKVNRHVLKALHTLSNGNVNKVVTISQILTQVKYQMYNLVPVANIDMVIQKSMKNLSDIGLIHRYGQGKFSIGPSPSPNTNTTKRNRNIFKASGSRKRKNSQLNPNSKRARYDSDSSLSGDKYDQPRKRLRTNNKRINFVGRKSELPKSRKYQLEGIVKRNASKQTFANNLMAITSFDQNLEMPFNGSSEDINVDSESAKFLECQPQSSPFVKDDSYNANKAKIISVSEIHRNISSNLSRVWELQPFENSEIVCDRTNSQQLPVTLDTEIERHLNADYASLRDAGTSFDEKTDTNLNVVELYNNSKSFNSDHTTTSRSTTKSLENRPSKEKTDDLNLAIKQK